MILNAYLVNKINGGVMANSEYVIIGSTALKAHAEAMGIEGYREPRDIDIWYYGHNPKEYITRVEGRLDCHEMPKEIVEAVLSESLNNGSEGALRSLYTIKLAHAAWDIKWEKTVADITYFQKIIKIDKPIDYLYDMLYRHWVAVHGSKDFLSLNKPKDDFFNDAVSCTYDHDYLHSTINFYGKPLYERVLREGHNVMIDKTKFLELPLELQVEMLQEEMMVIALERWLIPLKFNISKVEAYYKARKLVVTRLTKGWVTQFILENWIQFAKMPKLPFDKIFINMEKLNGQH